LKDNFAPALFQSTLPLAENPMVKSLQEIFTFRRFSIVSIPRLTGIGTLNPSTNSRNPPESLSTTFSSHFQRLTQLHQASNVSWQIVYKIAPVFRTLFRHMALEDFCHILLEQALHVSLATFAASIAASNNTNNSNTTNSSSSSSSTNNTNDATNNTNTTTTSTSSTTSTSTIINKLPPSQGHLTLTDGIRAAEVALFILRICSNSGNSGSTNDGYTNRSGQEEITHYFLTKCIPARSKLLNQLCKIHDITGQTLGILLYHVVMQFLSISERRFAVRKSSMLLTEGDVLRSVLTSNHDFMYMEDPRSPIGIEKQGWLRSKLEPIWQLIIEPLSNLQSIHQKSIPPAYFSVPFTFLSLFCQSPHSNIFLHPQVCPREKIMDCINSFGCVQLSIALLDGGSNNNNNNNNNGNHTKDQEEAISNCISSITYSSDCLKSSQNFDYWNLDTLTQLLT